MWARYGTSRPSACCTKANFAMSLDGVLHAHRRRAFGTVTAALLAIAVALSVVCCTREPQSSQHTVAEYRSNPDLRREQFARCANDPGTLGKTPDCTNAREAQRLEDMRSVRDLPPVRLLPPQSKPNSDRPNSDVK